MKRPKRRRHNPRMVPTYHMADLLDGLNAEGISDERIIDSVASLIRAGLIKVYEDGTIQMTHKGVLLAARRRPEELEEDE